MIELLGVGGGKTDSIRSTRDYSDDSALQVALKINHQIEASTAHGLKKRHERPGRVPPIVNDQFVQPLMSFDDRAGLGLYRPCDMRVRPSSANAPEQRQRPHHVANRAEQDYQYAIWYRNCDYWALCGHHSLQRTMITAGLPDAKPLSRA